MKEENPNDNELQFENELKKLKLTAERGAQFFTENNENLPPSLESKWLEQIKLFHEESDKRVVKKVREIIGNPALPLESEVGDTELPEALQIALDLLDHHDISLDVLHEVPEREVYRFIIEELLDHEMEVINVPGMKSCFIYEEFHPNDMEDLKQYTKEFLDMLFDKKFEFISGMLSSNLTFQDKEMSTESFIDTIQLLVRPFQFKLIDVNFATIEINEATAAVKFEVQFERAGANSPAKKIIETAQFEYVHKYGYWYLHKIEMPGLVSVEN